MAGHTPGPWRVVLLSQHDCVIGADGAIVVHELNTNEADGALIAAAPELLAELRELAALSDASIDEGDPALLGSFRDAARRLVAKAEGR